jgi:hypothetical protein
MDARWTLLWTGNTLRGGAARCPLPAGGSREVRGIVISLRAAVGRTCGERGLISLTWLERQLWRSS